MALLEARDLVYTYPTGTTALRGVDLAVERGEFVAVLGPNASGKTTLLRHFAGLLKPTRGQVFVQGREVRGQDGGWLYRVVGFAFQDPNDQLFAPTVGEDVAFGPRNAGLPEEEVEALVGRSLAMVGLAGLEARPIATLSFGQKRRAALAGVLALEPRIVVLDEPTSGLDPVGGSRIMGLLHRLNRRQAVTMLMATQDIDVVPAYADRVYVLRAGKVEATGPPAAVFAQVEALRRSGLRLPRAAHALMVIGQEWGKALAELPLSAEELPWETEAEEGPLTHRGGGARWGFTTGAAAAAAAKAAAEFLFYGHQAAAVELRSPMGATLTIPIAQVRLAGRDARTGSGARLGAVATVIKDAGRPGDPTDGAEICALVRAADAPGVAVRGGQGVGRVSRPGLPVRVGEAAINPVPRQMIADAVGSLLPPGIGAEVTISVPRGEELAERILHPRSGIAGGIAILGTTGVARPGRAGRLMPILAGRAGSGGPKMTGVVLLGHGSRRGQATDQGLQEVVRRLRLRLGDSAAVSLAGFEFTRPSLEEAILDLARRGHHRIVVMPYFLFDGRHVTEEIPAELKRLGGLVPRVEICCTPTLGLDPRLADIVVERLRQALPRMGEDKLGVIVVNRGSHRQYDPGIRLRQLVSLVRGRLGEGVLVEPAHAEYASPTIEEAASGLVGWGARLIVVVPYILFPGKVLYDNILPAVEGCRRKYSGAAFLVAETLGVDDRMVDIAAERVRAGGV